MTRIGTSNLGIRLFLLVSLCAFLSTQSLADIYKWVDEDGEVTYSQKPPPSDYSSETIKEPPSPPEALDPDAPENTVQQRIEEEQKDLEIDAAKARMEQENAEIKRLNCGAASRNLKALEEDNQRNYMTADGDYLRPSTKKRQQLIDESKQQIKENCTP